MTRKRWLLWISTALSCGLTVCLLAAPLSAQVHPPPLFSKVVVIIFENTEFDEIIGNPDAPFFNQLASQYGLATNYFGITHPSLPNYLALVGGDTFGIRDNCEDLRRCNRHEPFPSNLVDQVESTGRTWKAYMEAMPRACYVGSAYPYAQRHNPFIYFDTIRLSPQRCANIEPYDAEKPLADFALLHWCREQRPHQVERFRHETGWPGTLEGCFCPRAEEMKHAGVGTRLGS